MINSYTELPWKIDGDKIVSGDGILTVCCVLIRYDAEYIVHACNNFHALARAGERCLMALAASGAGSTGGTMTLDNSMCPHCKEVAAIAGKDAILNLSEDAFCDEGSLTQKEIDHIAATVYQAIHALPTKPEGKTS